MFSWFFFKKHIIVLKSFQDYENNDVLKWFQEDEIMQLSFIPI